MKIKGIQNAPRIRVTRLRVELEKRKAKAWGVSPAADDAESQFSIFKVSIKKS